MKILAETGNGFILSATESEVGYIVGKRYSDDADLRTNKEIEVSKIFSQWDKMTSNHRDLSVLQRWLQGWLRWIIRFMSDVPHGVRTP